MFAAPTAVILGEHRQVQPDLVFVSKSKRALITKREIEGSPDLAVEIVSPSSARIDRVTKASIYADSGVAWYWIVDPDPKTLEEYQLEEREYQLIRKWAASEQFEPRSFPGMSFPLAELFEWDELDALG